MELNADIDNMDIDYIICLNNTFTRHKNYAQEFPYFRQMLTKIDTCLFFHFD